VCPSCDVDCRTPKALNGHEKSEHSATYKSRPEIFTPFFCPFQRMSTQLAEGRVLMLQQMMNSASRH
jgi:hypothetical protein